MQVGQALAETYQNAPFLAEGAVGAIAAAKDANSHWQGPPPFEQKRNVLAEYC